jgi:hypothetical protein
MNLSKRLKNKSPKLRIYRFPALDGKGKIDNMETSILVMK